MLVALRPLQRRLSLGEADFGLATTEWHQQLRAECRKGVCETRTVLEYTVRSGGRSLPGRAFDALLDFFLGLFPR